MRLQALILSAAIGLSPSAATAAAIFSADASSSFVIAPGTATTVEEMPTGVLVTGTAILGVGPVLTSGIGVSPITVDSALFGSSGPAGTATGAILSGHLIEIDNSLGSAPIIASFTFDYSFDISASVLDPVLESAFASAFFHITGIDNETLFVDGLGVVPEWLLNPVVEVGAPGMFLSLGAMGLPMSISGSITVPAGESSAFSVITDVAGGAFSAEISEPASIALLGLGLTGLAIARRRASR